MKNFIIFGPPGAGKGSQCVILSKKYNFRHISTGDILREEVKRESELGLKVKSLMDKGELVSDTLIIKIIEGVLVNSTDVEGFLYDGFPRTVKQSQALEELLKKLGQKIDAVISLHADEDVIIKRIQGRAAVEGREDDARTDVVKKRLDVYREQTHPLVEIYKKKGIYHPINGNLTIEQNFAEICEFIDQQ
jgi:adenylate kinase